MSKMCLIILSALPDPDFGCQVHHRGKVRRESFLDLHQTFGKVIRSINHVCCGLPNNTRFVLYCCCTFLNASMLDSNRKGSPAKSSTRNSGMGNDLDTLILSRPLATLSSIPHFFAAAARARPSGAVHAAVFSASNLEMNISPVMCTCAAWRGVSGGVMNCAGIYPAGYSR